MYRYRYTVCVYEYIGYEMRMLSCNMSLLSNSFFWELRFFFRDNFSIRSKFLPTKRNHYKNENTEKKKSGKEKQSKQAQNANFAFRNFPLHFSCIVNATNKDNWSHRAIGIDSIQ